MRAFLAVILSALEVPVRLPSPDTTIENAILLRRLRQRGRTLKECSNDAVPSLFEVTHPDLSSPSYLLGTIHYPYKAMTPFPAAVESAIQCAASGHFELAESAMENLTPAQMLQVQTCRAYQGGRSPKTVLGEAKYDASVSAMLKMIEESCGSVPVFEMPEEIALLMATMEQILGMWELTKLTVSYMLFSVEQVVSACSLLSDDRRSDDVIQSGGILLDDHIRTRFLDEKKPVGVVDLDMSGQIDMICELFGAMPAEIENEVIDAIIESVSADEPMPSGDAMLNDYLCGNELAVHVDLSSAADVWMVRTMTVERNAVMARKSELVMRRDPENSHVFAVGALHYEGISTTPKIMSVNEYLEAEGFTVTRIRQPAGSPALQECKKARLDVQSVRASAVVVSLFLVLSLGHM